MIRLGAIGLGNRACKYLKYVEENPGLAELAAVAEPDVLRRTQIAERFRIDPSFVFSSADDMLSADAGLDAVIIASPDSTHYSYSLQAIRKGYAVLLEKPVAASLHECIALEKAASEHNVLVSVCYVLRFHPLYQRLKKILAEGSLGRILSIRHIIHIGADRMTHTFVRGLWSREEESSPIILSKASHDIDILYWLTGQKAVNVSSAAKLKKFHADNAPEGSSARCADCALEDKCPFSAVDLYLRRSEWNRGFDVFPGETANDAVMRELLSGRYGRCVYRCGNNVPDSQTVDLVLESGATVHLEMDGCSMQEGRETFVSCENGEIYADSNGINVRSFSPDKVSYYDMSAYAGMPLHGGADTAVIADFIAAVSGKQKLAGADIASAIHSHEVCFWAEKSRRGLSGI
ncbi:MAG: Gfo/Idh/MocA family oxidoreductase [Bacteroidales bacterium]|nr:Gfo/Idh/MocA family oxidoreductase [Bacteroidales bacterium]